MEQIKLPRRPLTNIDLYHYAQRLSIPYFRGVYMRDTLPDKPRVNESCIVNLEPLSKPGSHWVAIYKRKREAYYFDSFGDLRPPLEVIHYLRGCRIRYNYNQYQSFDSIVCGHLCLQFLNTHAGQRLTSDALQS